MTCAIGVILFACAALFFGVLIALASYVGSDHRNTGLGGPGAPGASEAAREDEHPC